MSKEVQQFVQIIRQAPKKPEAVYPMYCLVCCANTNHTVRVSNKHEIYKCSKCEIGEHTFRL